MQTQRGEARGGGGMGEREELLREWIFELWLLEEGKDILGREDRMKKGKNVSGGTASAPGFSGLLSCSSWATCWWWKGQLMGGLCPAENLVYPLAGSEVYSPQGSILGWSISTFAFSECPLVVLHRMYPRR